MTDQIIEDIHIFQGHHDLMNQAKARGDEDKAQEFYVQALIQMDKIEKLLKKLDKKLVRDYGKENG